MNRLVGTISESELRFIASLDYGQDAERHLEALRHVIHGQSGVLKREQDWFPYEVIELGSYSLKPGHEREFAICTLLVIQAVASGFDRGKGLRARLNESAGDYYALPPSLRDEILDAYVTALDNPR